VEIEGVSPTARAPFGTAREIEVDFVLDGSAAMPAARVVVPLDGAAVTRAADGGVRVLARLTLAPGPHVLRVAVRDAGGLRSASLVHAFEVPVLLVGSLTMSDLLLSGSGVTGVTHPAPEEDALFPLVGKPPTGRRRFSRGEKIEVDAEIYETPLDDGFSTQMTITTSLLTPQGAVVYESTDIGTSETLPSGVFGYPHYTLVPTAAVPPGDYVIRVLAAVDGDAGGATWRAIPITIVN
jgi:hypothetical protein